MTTTARTLRFIHAKRAKPLPRPHRVGALVRVIGERTLGTIAPRYKGIVANWNSDEPNEHVRWAVPLTKAPARDKWGFYHVAMADTRPEQRLVVHEYELEGV